MIPCGILYTAFLSCLSHQSFIAAFTSAVYESTSLSSNYAYDTATGNSTCIDLLSMSSGEVNHTWIVQLVNSRASNIFSVSKGPSCNVGELSFYDFDKDGGNVGFVADACTVSEDSFAGRPGYPTLVVHTAPSGVYEDNITAFCYSSREFAQELCPQTMMELTASKERETIHIFDSVRSPNNVTCLWNIRAPDKSVLHVQVHKPKGRTGDNGNCSDSGDLLTVLISGVPENGDVLADVTNTIFLCDDAVNLTETSLRGYVGLALEADGYGGASPISFTYWVEDIRSLCPDQPMQLQAVPGQVRAFKGVSRDIGTTEARSCEWNVTAPPGLVVKLSSIINTDYLKHVHVNDFLRFNGARPIALNDNEAFPYWSDGSSLLLQFQTPSGSERSEFVIFYTAVPWTLFCQGHLLLLVADVQAHSMTLSSLPTNDTSGNTFCRLQVVAGQEDRRVRITLTSLGSGSSVSTPEVCPIDACKAYEGYIASSDALLLPRRSQQEKNAVEYVSDKDAILFTFRRRPGYPQHGLNLTILAFKEPNVSNCAAFGWLSHLFFCAVSIAFVTKY